MSNDEYRAEQAERRQHGLKARHEQRLARAQERKDPFTSLRECLAFSSNDWGSAGDFAWLYGVISGWQDEEGDSHDVLAAKFGWPPHQVERLRQLHANFNAAEELWNEPTLTAAEVKVLTEAALRLGRKEAADQIAAYLDGVHEEIGDGAQRELFADLAETVRDIGKGDPNG